MTDWHRVVAQLRAEREQATDQHRQKEQTGAKSAKTPSMGTLGTETPQREGVPVRLLAEAEAAYRAAWERWWSAPDERAGAMIDGDSARLAEVEPKYLAARDGYVAAGDALEALDPGWWDRGGCRR